MSKCPFPIWKMVSSQGLSDFPNFMYNMKRLYNQITTCNGLARQGRAHY